MDLSYLNARIRGLRGRLLRERDYNALLKVRGLDECMDYLRSTVYGPYIEVASVYETRKDSIVTTALRNNLGATLSVVWDEADIPSREALRMVFSFWEVYNLKTIIRAIHRGVRKEEILPILIPVGTMDYGALKELAQSKNIHDLVRLLDTWTSPYSAPVKEGLEWYERHNSLFRIEDALYRYVFAEASRTTIGDSSNREVLEGFFARRVDTQNMVTLFKVTGEGLSEGDREGLFIEGGRLLSRKEFLRLLILPDRKTLIRELIPVIKDHETRDILFTADTDEIDLLEERFEELTRKYLRRESLRDPLGIALVMDYVYAKVREVKNLRVIVRGKVFGIPEEEIRRFLFF